MRRSITTWPVSLLVFLAATSMSAAIAQAQTSGETYTINPGDQIEVYVWGDERLQRTIRVLPDGSFSFPLVGRVIAEGLKPTDVEARVSKALATQYHGEPPQVTVSVSDTAGYTFSVVGRVKSTNTFRPGRYVNVMEAIAMAGGPDEFANLDNVTILRKADKGLTTQRIRLGGFMKGNISNSDANAIPQIEVGDTVIVP